MKSRFWFFQFVLPALLVIAACGPGHAPDGQPPIALLTPASLETLRHDFNAAADRTRVILLLSPT